MAAAPMATAIGCGTPSQKKHFSQGICDPPWFTLVRKRGKLFQKKGQSRPRDILVRQKSGRIVHAGAPFESERRTNHLPFVKAKSSLTRLPSRAQPPRRYCASHLYMVVRPTLKIRATTSGLSPSGTR